MLLLAFAGVALAATVKDLVTGLYGPRHIAYSNGRLFVTESGRSTNGAVELTRGGSVIAIGVDDEHSEAHARYAKHIAQFDSYSLENEVVGPAGVAVDGDRVFVSNGIGGFFVTDEHRREAGLVDQSVTLGTLATFEVVEASSSSSSSSSSASVKALSSSSSSSSSSSYAGSDDTDGYRILANVGAWSVEHQTVTGLFQNGTRTGIDSNPYGLTLGADGVIFVADAGANKVVSVKNGVLKNVAFFDQIFCAGVDQTPTSVAIGPDGMLYVSTLELRRNLGFVGQSCARVAGGSSNIYRIDPSSVGKVVSAADIYATGFNGITNIHWSKSLDALLVVEYFGSKVKAIPNAGTHNKPAPGPVVTYGAGVLKNPNGVTTDDEGTIYVTDCSAGPDCDGKGRVVAIY